MIVYSSEVGVTRMLVGAVILPVGGVRFPVVDDPVRASRLLLASFFFSRTRLWLGHVTPTR